MGPRIGKPCACPADTVSSSTRIGSHSWKAGPARATGRSTIGSRAPLVPDGTIYRVLENLLLLDGERISYRALDVEQIGSVYETMMGFRLETTTGRSLAIRAAKKHGAPTDY